MGGAVAAAVVGVLSAAPAMAEPATKHGRPVATTPGGRDFPKVGGNLGNQNYSALDGIHRGNVRKLGATWVNRIEGGLTTGTNQSTAVAVDGASGVTKWEYRQTRGTLTRRGVAVGDGRVFTHGKGGWIIALDQETGA